MLKDMTFGQFFPAESFVHKLDARIKIVLTLGLIVLAFVAFNFWGLGLMAVVTADVMLLSKVPAKFYFKTLKPIWPFLLITAVLNIFYGSGEPLWQWGFLAITADGLTRALFVAIRVVLLIFISATLTYTTSPTALTDAIESLLKPLSMLGVDIHSFAMMMTIALRFIPTLMEETDKIMSAQKARGADMDTGGLIDKIKSVIPILIPLLISSYRRARELADAMECRCYHGGKGRTRLRVQKAGSRDFLALAGFGVLTAGIVLLNLFL